MNSKKKLIVHHWSQLLLATALVFGSASTIPVKGALGVPNIPSVRDILHPAIAQDPDEVTLTLHDSGFTPAAVTRPAGPFQLSVDNRSGSDDLTLVLKGSDEVVIREMRVRSGDWSELLDLTAGTYTLSEANHINWVCQIIVR